MLYFGEGCLKPYWMGCSHNFDTNGNGGFKVEHLVPTRAACSRFPAFPGFLSSHLQCQGKWPGIMLEESLPLEFLVSFMCLYVFLSGCRRTIPSVSAELWPNYQPNQRVTSGKHLKSMVVQLACHSDVSAADAIHHCTIPGVFSQRHGVFLQIDRFSMDEWWEVCVLKMKPNVNLTSGRQKPCFWCGNWDVSAPFLPSYFTRAPCCLQNWFHKKHASSKSAADDLMQKDSLRHHSKRVLACNTQVTCSSDFLDGFCLPQRIQSFLQNAMNGTNIPAATTYKCIYTHHV